jgi:cobyrinic acid a,c-diamide synthase
MTLVIAGERSGVGKTTIALSLLAYLCRLGLSVQSFKVGPDYIDPMFHQHITRRMCRNLDPVLTSEVYVQQCFVRCSQNIDCALIEGVMGLFDGASGSDDFSSTAHIARLLDLPILLVLDCSRLSRSVAAIAHGYRSFDPRLKIAGVVLNRVGSDRHLELLTAALEPLNLPILGVLRRQDNITIPDRHLGLIPTAELSEIDALIDRLADLGATGFNWSQLLPLLTTTQDISKVSGSSIISTERITITQSPVLSTKQNSKLKIAVAFDRAFSFYYADNLELLEQLGAELVYWSPIADAGLPEGVQGLYFGGGFPEVFAAALSDNQAARKSVRAAIAAGMPAYAECGGLMYLSQAIVDFAEKSWPMAGILPTTARMSERLTLGYRQAVALRDSCAIAATTTVWGHEFHRSLLSIQADQPLFQTQGYDPRSPFGSEGWCYRQVHASYIHLHWGIYPEIPLRFLKNCVET